MSVPTPEPTPTAPLIIPATAADPAPAPGDPAAEPLGEGGIKALQAERDRSKDLEKQLKTASDKLTEIARANETAIEKAQREATEAAENAKTATVTAFREAAIKFGGISTEDAELFLTGTDAETLTKQAARLVERTPTSPMPDLTQGGKGTPSTGDPAKDFANWMAGALPGSK